MGLERAVADSAKIFEPLSPTAFKNFSALGDAFKIVKHRRLKSLKFSSQNHKFLKLFGLVPKS
jgi:hypothetical protein